MRKLSILLFSVLTLALQTVAQQKNITGFPKETTDAELKLEEKFDSYLKADNLDQWMKKLSARPHHISSPFGKTVAEFVRDQFKSWGYDTEIETYKVLFPTP